MFEFLKKFSKKTSEEKKFELGATVTKKGVHFSLFSHNATQVFLCLFDEKDRETKRIPLERKGDTWEVDVDGLKAGQRYGYRVDGPYDPNQGHRFNVNKLLLDPAAKQLTGPVKEHDSQLPYDPEDPMKEYALSKEDSAPYMPKCVVVDTRKLESQKSTRPYLPYDETVVYETHVKGLTAGHPDVKENEKGKFSGLKNRQIQSHFQDLGISSVELLPIYAFVQPKFLQDRNLKNYWGYDPICFMAPNSDYIGGSLEEIRQAVDQLHKKGKEVILDVVYNHTGEGSGMGPSLCYRGIDNASYYKLDPNCPHNYMDDTGCLNTLNLSNPAVCDLVVQSLRYWARVLDIDGFRFDLAATLGRNEFNEFKSDAPFFKAIQADPLLSKLKMIAEPWDLGPNSYQLNSFPAPFMEWNDQFRDTTRRFWKGDEGLAGCLMYQMVETNRKINFITAHDGFTLYDLVSYNEKHNESNGENNNDGNNTNHSWNSGAEGLTDNQDIENFRLRRAKAMMATLLLSNGTPMILGGDECLRTQNGNNNTYCQDNEITWQPWINLSQKQSDMKEFTKECLKLRRQMIRGNPQEIRPIKPDGTTMNGEDWLPYMRSFGYVIQPSDSESKFLVVLNASVHCLDYHIPADLTDQKWETVLNTAAEKSTFKKDLETTACSVEPWSMCVLKTKGRLGKSR